MSLFVRRPGPVRLLLDAQASRRVMAGMGAALAWEQARRLRARRMARLRGVAWLGVVVVLLFAAAGWLWL